MDGLDHRDRAVIEQLEAGQEVRYETLERAYYRTDIRQRETAKQRVKLLTERPEFEYVGLGRWKFRGVN